jgi:Sec-independent protein secretion pathway component TatC
MYALMCRQAPLLPERLLAHVAAILPLLAIYTLSFVLSTLQNKKKQHEKARNARKQLRNSSTLTDISH